MILPLLILAGLALLVTIVLRRMGMEIPAWVVLGLTALVVVLAVLHVLKPPPPLAVSERSANRIMGEYLAAQIDRDLPAGESVGLLRHANPAWTSYAKDFEAGARKVLQDAGRPVVEIDFPEGVSTDLMADGAEVFAAMAGKTGEARALLAAYPMMGAFARGWSRQVPPVYGFLDSGTFNWQPLMQRGRFGAIILGGIFDSGPAPRGVSEDERLFLRDYALVTPDKLELFSTAP